jgi:hypothetical protein
VIRARLLVAPLIAVGVVLGAVACAPEPSGADGDLSALVEVAAEQAAAGDLAAAGKTIDALERRVVGQRDTGALDGQQAAAILETVALVRADLTALAPAPAPPSPTPSAETDDSDDDNSGSDGKTEGNSGNGKGNAGINGKGNGNGGDDED